MSSYTESWGHQEGASWNEEEAIRLLQEAGAEAAMYEEDGARMPREIVGRHKAGLAECEQALGITNVQGNDAA